MNVEQCAQLLLLRSKCIQKGVFHFGPYECKTQVHIVWNVVEIFSCTLFQWWCDIWVDSGFRLCYLYHKCGTFEQGNILLSLLLEQWTYENAGYSSIWTDVSPRASSPFKWMNIAVCYYTGKVCIRYIVYVYQMTEIFNMNYNEINAGEKNYYG